METYHGHVRTPNDAIILFEACRTGLLPRVQRRLSEKERQQIKSGSVFVWDEREAGMRRWTDGKSWSASRVSGSFLTYREMEGKRGGNSFSAPKKSGNKSDSGSKDGSDDDAMPDDGYRYKPDGLMKQSFSITTSTGQHLHLISYYSRASPTSQTLMQPSQDPTLRHIRPQKGMYPESSVNEQSSVPAVTRGPMGGSPFTTAPHQMGSPYARAGPPVPAYAIHAPPGSWPPSPLGTPPHAYTHYYAPAHPGYIAHPPHPYSHPYPHPHPHPHHPGFSAPTVFDRPPQGPPASGLPPPPPPLSNGHPFPHMAPPPQHQPNLSPRAQRISSGPVTSAPGYPPHSYPQYESPQDRIALPAPTTSGPQLPPVKTSAPATNGKPMASPPSKQAPPPTSSAEAQTNGETSNGGPPTTSTGKIFPSIHALVNGTSEPAETRSDTSGNSRQGSRSPNGPLPHVSNRISGFGEDSKALRSLDKAFLV